MHLEHCLKIGHCHLVTTRRFLPLLLSAQLCFIQASRRRPDHPMHVVSEGSCSTTSWFMCPYSFPKLTPLTTFSHHSPVQYFSLGIATLPFITTSSVSCPHAPLWSKVVCLSDDAVVSPIVRWFLNVRQLRPCSALASLPAGKLKPSMARARSSIVCRRLILRVVCEPCKYTSFLRRLFRLVV